MRIVVWIVYESVHFTAVYSHRQSAAIPNGWTIFLVSVNDYRSDPI